MDFSGPFLCENGLRLFVYVEGNLDYLFGWVVNRLKLYHDKETRQIVRKTTKSPNLPKDQQVEQVEQAWERWKKCQIYLMGNSSEYKIPLETEGGGFEGTGDGLTGLYTLRYLSYTSYSRTKEVFSRSCRTTFRLLGRFGCLFGSLFGSRHWFCLSIVPFRRRCHLSSSRSRQTRYFHHNTSLECWNDFLQIVYIVPNYQISVCICEYSKFS